MDKKPRVGMDISQIAHNGGVSTYTQKLASKLELIKDLDMVYFYSSLRNSYKGSLKNVKSYKLPPTLFEVLFNKLRNVPIEKFIGDIDIFHSSDWTQPPAKAKKITTYHDVVPLKYPKWSHPKIISVHKKRLKIVEEEIDKVIAVSESTKHDLLEVSRIPEEKIVVIYEAPTISSGLVSEEDIEAFKRKYDLPKNFLLAIGGIGERRNIERIKEAAKGYNLIVSGQDLPWVSNEELKLLYASADALVYCSLYEGFGIPILDAFLAGCPVITSNISSMPEVGGEAAIYVNPLDIEDIKKKINMVLQDKDLKDEKVKLGLKRVEKFSWQRCADQTAQVYRELLK